MDLYILIKILGILIIIVSCIVSTYTDVRFGIISNKLTFSVFLIGLILSTFYFYLLGMLNLFYYVSIVIIFLLSYLLWRLGVWAGGDVKLFTAISTLFIPEFLSVIPHYTLGFLVLPMYSSSYSIPTLWLIFNSILSVVPLIIIMITYIIFKKKRYLINSLLDISFIYRGILNLNLLVISYVIITFLDVYSIILKIVFILLFTFFFNKIIRENKYVIIILTISVIVYQILYGNMMMYLLQLLFIEIIYITQNIMKNNLISEVLSDNYNVKCLNEGMILAYPLCYHENTYFFDKTSTFHRLKNKMRSKNNNTRIVITNMATGISKNDIILLEKLVNDKKIDNIPIKRGLPFAPFILSGLFITLLFGNTIKIIILLMELL